MSPSDFACCVWQGNVAVPPAVDVLLNDFSWHKLHISWLHAHLHSVSALRCFHWDCLFAPANIWLQPISRMPVKNLCEIKIDASGADVEDGVTLHLVERPVTQSQQAAPEAAPRPPQPHAAGPSPAGQQQGGEHTAWTGHLSPLARQDMAKHPKRLCVMASSI